MRRYPPLLLIIAGLLASDAAPARDYQFDKIHSQVGFEISHLGFSMSQGRFKGLDGDFSFDPKNWQNARCDVRIDVASLDMGDAGWRKKLLGKSWFDVAQFPQMRFVCSALEQSDEHQGILRGDLTLHGVTRPVSLALTFNRAGLHKYALKHVAGFSARTSILRSDFGIDNTLPEVGNEVGIRIEIEGSLRKKS